MNDFYIEFTIPASGDERDILISELSEQSFEGFVEHEESFSAFVPEKDFNRKNFEELLLAYEIPLSNVNEQRLEQRNWNAEWEASYEPICIGSDIYIKTPFHPVRDDFKYQLTIQPKMSFGTGHHETTRLMLQLMLHENIQSLHVFDYGCGTGVLSVMASILGAQDIFAVDIDDWAAENLHENAALNQVKNIQFVQGDISQAEGKQFDCILANINKNILLNTMKQMAACLKSGGLLMMSGFYQNDVDDLLNSAHNYGVTLKQKLSENSWTALVVQKN